MSPAVQKTASTALTFGVADRGEDEHRPEARGRYRGHDGGEPTARFIPRNDIITTARTISKNRFHAHECNRDTIFDSHNLQNVMRVSFE